MAKIFDYYGFKCLKIKYNIGVAWYRKNKK